MNNLSKAKLVFYLIAIFVAGGVTGAAVAVKATKQIMTEAPRTGHLEARYLKERFQTKLGLTPEQSKIIEPILEKMSEELKSIRLDTTKRISAIVKSSYAQIGKGLTPAQRQKLEEMAKDHHENTHRRFKSPSDSRSSDAAFH